jgi:hypothetical protein
MKQAGKEDAALEKQIEVGAPREGGGGEAGLRPALAQCRQGLTPLHWPAPWQLPPRGLPCHPQVQGSFLPPVQCLA